MISTFEIVFIVVLLILIGIAIWWLVIAHRYKGDLATFSYSRGANVDLKTRDKANVNMTCDSDREICVWRATAICSGSDSNNYESSPLEPIASGTTEDKYSSFDTNTTIDLTHDLAAGNGKENYTYTFDSNKLVWPHGKKCPSNYNSSTGTGTRPQLIATYSCIPKGTKCNMYTPKV